MVGGTSTIGGGRFMPLAGSGGGKAEDGDAGKMVAGVLCKWVRMGVGLVKVQMMVVWQVGVVGVHARQYRVQAWWEMGRRSRNQEWLAHVKGIWRVAKREMMAKMGDTGGDRSKGAEAEVEGPVRQSGQERGMVLDFGFLKEEMVSEIEKDCDHTLILALWDDLVKALHPPENLKIPSSLDPAVWFTKFDSPWGSVYLIADTPTAENLARHWAMRLGPMVETRTSSAAHLRALRVWETPNCWAEYRS